MKKEILNPKETKFIGMIQGKNRASRRAYGKKYGRKFVGTNKPLNKQEEYDKTYR